MATETSSSNAVRNAVRRLFRLLALEKEGLYVVIVYAIGIGIASLGAPIGVQMLVSAIAFGGLAQPIAILSLLVLIALSFAAALRAAQSWIVERIQQRLFVRVASDLSARLPRISVPAIDGYHGPELVNRFFDVLTLQKGAAMLLLDGLFVALQVTVGGILLAAYHPALIALATVILLLIGVILFGLGRRGAVTSIAESKEKYALVAWFEEVARHPTLYRSEGADRFAAEKCNALITKYVDARKAHYRIVFRQTVAFLVLQAFATTALLAVGGALVLHGQLTLGQLVAAELILTSVVAGFAKFGKYVEIYYDLIAAMDKLGKLVDLPLEREGGHEPAMTGPLHVEVLEVEYRHEDRSTEGLAGFSLDVPAGERVAVIGPNGSGKSTLIDLVFGLREPSRGRVEINGLPLSELSISRLRSSIALVRGAEIFEGTIMENVCMGREDVSLEDVQRALEAVGMWEEVAALPDGLGTHLTTNGGNVSAGQAQRLAIARALVGRPRCLLLDEALDHLDPASRSTILERVLGRDAPWTAIVATHDPLVADACTVRRYIGPTAEAGNA